MLKDFNKKIHQFQLTDFQKLKGNHCHKNNKHNQLKKNCSSIKLLTISVAHDLKSVSSSLGKCSSFPAKHSRKTMEIV